MKEGNALPLILLAILLIGGAFYWGYQLALHRHPEFDPVSVRHYIDTNFPNEWAAYKKGVFEGYEQGLRDGAASP